MGSSPVTPGPAVTLCDMEDNSMYKQHVHAEHSRLAPTRLDACQIKSGQVVHQATS